MSKKLLKPLFIGLLIGVISLSCEKKDEEDNKPSTTSSTSSTSTTASTASTSSTGTTSSTSTTSTSSTTSSTSSTSSTSTTGSVVTSPGVIPGKDKLVIGKTTVSLSDITCYSISSGGVTSLTITGSNEGVDDATFKDLSISVISSGAISAGNINLSFQSTPSATISVTSNNESYSSSIFSSGTINLSIANDTKTFTGKSLELSNDSEKIMVDFNFTCVGETVIQ